MIDMSTQDKIEIPTWKGPRKNMQSEYSDNVNINDFIKHLPRILINRCFTDEKCDKCLECCISDDKNDKIYLSLFSNLIENYINIFTTDTISEFLIMIEISMNFKDIIKLYLYGQHLYNYKNAIREFQKNNLIIMLNLYREITDSDTTLLNGGTLLIILREIYALECFILGKFLSPEKFSESHKIDIDILTTFISNGSIFLDLVDNDESYYQLLDFLEKTLKSEFCEIKNLNFDEKLKYNIRPRSKQVISKYKKKIIEKEIPVEIRPRSKLVLSKYRPAMAKNISKENTKIDILRIIEESKLLDSKILQFIEKFEMSEADNLMLIAETKILDYKLSQIIEENISYHHNKK